MAPSTAAVDTLVTSAGFDPVVQAGSGTTGALFGTFASAKFSLAQLTAGLSWNFFYASNSVTLSITGAATFTADFDHNGQAIRHPA